jgi:hypothetical protein
MLVDEEEEKMTDEQGDSCNDVAIVSWMTETKLHAPAVVRRSAVAYPTTPAAWPEFTKLSGLYPARGRCSSSDQNHSNLAAHEKTIGQCKIRGYSARNNII